MRHFLKFPLALLASLALVPLGGSGQPKWQPSPHVAASDPLPPEEELKGLHVPPGFIVQLVAAEPKIKKPINIAFDAMGRLWVTESVEYPFPAPPGQKPRDTVKILEDFGHDGRARKITTFAGGLNIPIGVLPLGPGAVIYSIPNVYSMVDSDGDGRADRRDVLLGTYGHNDTHGMTGEFVRGFDGWIYACHGFSNTSTVKSMGQAITMQSGNTYRFQPDGSRVEYHTHGQVNPFGLALDPAGNLYSCDCHSRPIYQLLRGAYYPSFGRPHDGLGFGPEMMHHDHGSTAIAGIAYYAARQYPEEFRDNIFIGNVVTNRINRDRLQWHGSSPQAIAMPDFVKSDDPWFRPVDIKLGPDGALYVADFYNRIIGHYEVPLNHPGRDRERGRIWRLVYQGPEGKNPLPAIEDLTRLNNSSLVARLNHDNLSVRMQAMHLLVERGGPEVIKQVREALNQGSHFQKAHGLWVLERLQALDDKTFSGAASNTNNLVRIHAMRLLAEREKWGPGNRQLVLEGLKDSDASVQRAAAEALGRHPQAENVKPLLELRHKVPAEDTHLLHVVRMALRDQLVPAIVWEKLGKTDWDEKDLRALADICPGLRSQASALLLQTHIQLHRETNANLIRYVHHIARYNPELAGKSILEMAQKKFPTDLSMQAALFKALQQGVQERGSSLGEFERTWVAELVCRLLNEKAPADLQTGIELAGNMKIAGVQDLLISLIRNRKGPEPQRKSAVAALMSIQPAKQLGVAGKLVQDTAESMELREQAAVSLAGTNLEAAHAELVKALQAAPARLQRSIALALAGSKQGGEKLLQAVAAGKASARLLQVRPVADRLRQVQVPGLAERLAKLTRGLPPADQRLQELFNKRRLGFLATGGNPALGFKVFEKHCALCHQIANKGAKIGPQLDGIGIRGLDRLLEDILDPNRNVDQAFRATTLTLKNGQLMMGLFLRQDGAVLVMADNQGKEVRVPRASVEERIVSQLSPMPANLADQIPERDFYHLLGYLLAQKAK